MKGGFAVKRYGNLDHIVATGGNMGNGTGEVLLAVVLQHRGGSADRVPDDTTKQNFLNYLIQAPQMADCLRRLVAQLHDCTPGYIQARLADDIATAEALLGPLVEWHKLTGEREPVVTEYKGPWGIWIAEHEGYYTDSDSTILEFDTEGQANDFLRSEPLHLSSHPHHGETFIPRPLVDLQDSDPEVNAAGHKRVGYIVVNQHGSCVHGDDGSDPVSAALNMPSYGVLTGAAVDEARAIISAFPEGAYSIVPVYDGEVEEPEFYSASGSPFFSLT